MYAIAEILKNVSEYGFDFVSETVRTDNGKDILGNGPILVVRDVLKFDSAFPGIIRASLDGSSIRVISQRVVRNALKKNRRATDSELRVAVLSAVLGISTRTSLVYVLPDGSTTTDKDAALEAWKQA